MSVLVCRAHSGCTLKNFFNESVSPPQPNLDAGDWLFRGLCCQRRLRAVPIGFSHLIVDVKSSLLSYPSIIIIISPPFFFLQRVIPCDQNFQCYPKTKFLLESRSIFNRNSSVVLTKQSWGVIWVFSVFEVYRAVFAFNVYKIWLDFKNDCVVLINHVLNKLINLSEMENCFKGSSKLLVDCLADCGDRIYTSIKLL